ncbi:hypothetical protein Afil01_01680 [Actinorhabdospora filicis]|uniref:Lipoprotein signal peptidase n=2 Tax=Actinorhabdospora filicis TaxID=1785913 RepID=A0A9W6SH61_9ACTN|nr:hypothetical protein Afil01_01680 [Actinorhabdospora filicis]
MALLFALVGLGAIGLDLLTKTITVATLSDREPVKLLGGAVYLTLIRNGGAAWGMGSDYTWVISTVAVIVSVAIAWYAFAKVRSAAWAVALGLVFGGALGNIVDRIFRDGKPFHGRVVDMVSLFDPSGQVYPVFNLADSALVVGVCFVVFLELTGRRADGTRVRGKAKEEDVEKEEPTS